MSSLSKAPKWINAVAVVGFLLLVWLLIYGNLSGNLGFAENSQGYNDTETVINNFTTGFTNLASFAPTIFTILGVVLLIVVILVLLVIVMRISKPGGGKGYTSM